MASVPAAVIDDFRDYESVVLAMLSLHGGRLERRVRSSDGTREVHLVSFESRSAFESYVADPDRAACRARYPADAWATEVVEVDDVDDGRRRGT